MYIRATNVTHIPYLPKTKMRIYLNSSPDKYGDTLKTHAKLKTVKRGVIIFGKTFSETSKPQDTGQQRMRSSAYFFSC